MPTIETRLAFRRKGQTEIALVTLKREALKPINSDTIDGDIMLQCVLGSIADYHHFIALGKPIN